MIEMVGRFFKKNIVLVFLMVLFTAMVILKRDSFLSSINIKNLLVQISAYGIVAYAMTFAIIAGVFDLSVGSVLGMSTILFIDLSSKYSILVGMFVAILFGLVIGVINGLLVSKFKTDAFITTMATMLSVQGLALFYTSGIPINYNNDWIYELGNGSIAGIPYLICIMFVTMLISQFILSMSKFGRNLYATGGNQTVAKIAGINITFYIFMVFVILGVTSALAGILYASRVNAGSALYGRDLALYCVAAAVIGGARLSGGTGSAVKTLLGLIVMGILFNGLTLLKIKASYQDIIKGTTVIVVVVMDAIGNKKLKRGGM
jgi:ribose/xylose/arabinose/galactoside ABC-type transport system permease subunit